MYVVHSMKKYIAQIIQLRILLDYVMSIAVKGERAMCSLMEEAAMFSLLAPATMSH